jgi:hypothetical protein
MPFFLIPIALLAGSALVGGYGVKKGYDGVEAMRQAKHRVNRAERRRAKHIERFKQARKAADHDMTRLARQRLEVNQTTVARMV